MRGVFATKKRAQGGTVPPSPDPPPVADDADDHGGIDLELACDTCGCVVVWRIGEPYPEECPRCGPLR
jgi:hypothetical protein